MTPVETPTKLTFAQGLMLFFVQRIFDEHIMSTFFADDNTNKFLIQWSEIVRKGIKEDPNFPYCIKVPEDFGKAKPEGPESEITFIKEEEYREAYEPLLIKPEFMPLFPLLFDVDLGQLMQIEYTKELAELAKITAPAPKAESRDAEIIREAAARLLGKKPEELTKEDIEKVKSLNLSGREIKEIDSISEFKGLTSLDLADTQVCNIEPLGGLSNLLWLNLYKTQVSNIEPLKNLTKMQWLSLRGTQVSNIEPLKNLTKMQWLSLRGTQVSDIEPLKGLSNLQELDLSGTKVSKEQESALKKALPKLTIYH